MTEHNLGSLEKYGMTVTHGSVQEWMLKNNMGTPPTKTTA